MLAAGDPVRAAGLAADVVMLADSARLERDGVEARIVLGDALLGAGDEAQARSSYAAAVRRAAACPMPLRVADALDGLAVTLAVVRAGEDGEHRRAPSASSAPRWRYGRTRVRRVVPALASTSHGFRRRGRRAIGSPRAS